MPRPSRPLLALALAACAALALAACGEEDAKLLPGETAREITANLDTVQQLSAEGDCIGAESAAEQVGEQIEALEGVDPKLKRALEDGAVRLEEAIAGCEESTIEAIAPAVIPSEVEDEEKAPKEKKEKKEKPPKPKDEEAAEGPPPPVEETVEEEPVEEEGDESSSGGVSPGSPAGEGE